MNVKEILLSHKDLKYSEFSSGLIPGENAIIGVRLPILRKIAKEIAKYAYAIEYDAINPMQLYPTLESKLVEGLYE